MMEILNIDNFDLDIILKENNIRFIRKKLCRYKEKRAKWIQNRDEIMTKILETKIKCDSNVRKTLHDNKNMPLVFASGYKADRYWGVGLNKKMAAVCNEKEYRGRNRLGQLWEEVRDKYSDKLYLDEVSTELCNICYFRRIDVLDGICQDCFNI